MRDDGRRALVILDAIAVGDRLTQRELARELGVAVSLVNLSIRRLVRQGLIRVVSSHPPKPRYFLTPKGAEERSRLARTQLEWSFTRYRELRNLIYRILQPHVASGARRIALCGTGEAAEVAFICLLGCGVEEIAVFDGGRERVFLGRPIRDIQDFVPENFDRVIVATVDPSDSAVGMWSELAHRGIPADKIVSLVGPVGNLASASAHPAGIVQAAAG